MSFARKMASMLFALLTMLSAACAANTDACSLLTPAEIESALGAKLTQTIPAAVDPEWGCVYKLDRDQVLISYFADPAKGPKARSMREDPLMGAAAGPNVKDYGNIGCKLVDAQILFSTHCYLCQPRWPALAVQVHPPRKTISMDTVKGLLEKAGSRFK